MRTAVDHDCIRQLRVLHYLERAVAAELVEPLVRAGGSLTLHPFSRYVRGAQDVLELRMPGQYVLKAPLGQRLVVATYIRQAVREDPSLRPRVEAHLEAYERAEGADAR